MLIRLGQVLIHITPGWKPWWEGPANTTVSVWLFRSTEARTGLNTQALYEEKRPRERKWKKTKKVGIAAPLTV